ncbi:MAG: DUF4428 domain-containing protein [Deltaproteobacteria bacterium]|nr:DUF4428 domain-containing protein [Deltaproteobacteria bacterium]
MIDEGGQCSICGKETGKKHLFRIDNEWICTACIS